MLVYTFLNETDLLRLMIVLMKTLMPFKITMPIF